MVIKTSLPKLPILMQGLNLDICTPPPKIGEHSLEILSDLGYTSTNIDRLKESGTIAN